MALYKGPQLFPGEEYRSRCEKVKTEMRKAEFDALLVAVKAHTVYLTGYITGFACVPQAVVIWVNEEEPAFIMRKSWRS